MDRAFAEADHVVSIVVDNRRIAPVAIEPRAVLAIPDPLGDGLTLWVAAQSPFRLRAPLARLLGLPENRMRVVTPDVGGAFGAKNNLYREYVVAAWSALHLNRPLLGQRVHDVLMVVNRLKNDGHKIHIVGVQGAGSDADADVDNSDPLSRQPIPGSLLTKLNPLKSLDTEGRKDFAKRYRALQEFLDNPVDRLAVMDSQGIQATVNFATLKNPNNGEAL